MKRSFGNFLVVSFFGLSLSSCGDSNSANKNIKDSFRPAVADVARVSIAVSALDKEFLLQGSLITQDVIPMFNGLQSRVVSFRKSGDQLAMLQSPVGASISQVLEPKYLLATFPIKEVTETEVIFDFAAGMSQLFVASDWHAYDFEMPSGSPDLSSVPATVSYIDDVHYSSKNELVVRQVAQVSVPGMFGGSQTMPVEAVFYLSPYVSNPNFQKLESQGYERMGFFEVAAQLVDGVESILASHRDASKSVIYAISANTPAEYRQAISDGILYWNKALGKELIQVIDAPDGVTAPDADFNVIQWVDWDDAGFAYADAQMDPRTGEILHSQVFMTSAFAFHGKQTARKLLATMMAGAGNSQAKPEKKSYIDRKVSLKGRSKPKTKIKKFVGLKNLTQNHLCFRDETENIQKAVEQLLIRGASEEEVLKVSQDYIREVVAHEVGHTMGLRHNFAGSLSANFSMPERNGIFENYLKFGSVSSSVRSSSSVMEYQLFQEASMTGDFIAKASEVLSYDQKAIDTLYKGKKFKNSEIPLFCTDSLESQYNDCRVFDSGSSPMSYGLMQMNTQAETLVKLLAGIFVTIKTSPWARENEYQFGDIEVSPEALAGYLNAPRIDVLASLFYDLLPYIQIERQFRHISNSNMQEYMSKSRNFVASEVAANGGLFNLMPNFNADMGILLKVMMMNLLNDPQALSGFSEDGRAIVFTDAEKESIGNLMDQWSKAVDVFGIYDELYYLSLALELGAPVDGLQELANQKLAAYLLSPGLTTFEAEIKVKRINASSKKVKVKLPSFAYSFSARNEAVRSFGEMAGMGFIEANQSMASNGAALAERAKIAFGGIDMKEIDPSGLTGHVLNWYSEVSAILAALPH